MPKAVEPLQLPPPDVIAAVRVFGSTLRVALVHELDAAPGSISGLAAVLDVREMTVADNVRALVAEGVVTPVDADAPRRGPAPFLYQLEPDRLAVLVAALSQYASGRRTRRRRGTNHTHQP